MDRQIQKYPEKKILYLNWYEAAIGHLMLFKHYVQNFSHNVYFLISEQGIMLKATNIDYLKKVDDQLTKFFTAKIQQLDLSGSGEFYNNINQDIKQLTQKLKDARDCPYINLVSSQKLRNSCLAMKNHGYTKPYQNWECHQREKKGFCFLIVRPEHRWKEIATIIYDLARKRSPVQSTKQNSQLTWPVQICYQKFIWFYLKQSFKNLKKSLQIKDNKNDKCLTIIIKKDIPQFHDFQKQIESITFSYRLYRPKIQQQNFENKVVVLSALDIERITELVYHEFGLTGFAKEIRKKMTGFLVISSMDISDQLENIRQDVPEKPMFQLRDREDLICINHKKLNVIYSKLGRSHSIVNFEGTNYVQTKIQKPLKQCYEKILKTHFPCLPRYYYWYETQKNYFLLRSYHNSKFLSVYDQSKSFDQISLLYSLISIVEQLHRLGIYLGSALIDNVFVDQKRVIVEPDQNATKDEDISRLKKYVGQFIDKIKDNQLKNQIKSVYSDLGNNPFGIIQFLEQQIDSNS